jgi:hypothetical protein
MEAVTNSKEETLDSGFRRNDELKASDIGYLA